MNMETRVKIVITVEAGKLLAVCKNREDVWIECAVVDYATENRNDADTVGIDDCGYEYVVTTLPVGQAAPHVISVFDTLASGKTSSEEKIVNG